MKWSVVVPSCRQEKLEYFKQAWSDLFTRYKVDFIVIHDGPKPVNVGDYGYTEYHWDDIPDWIPKRTDMIRSWGFYQAWKNGSDFTLSLDDDVTPEGDIFRAYTHAFSRSWPLENYLSVGGLTNSNLEMRGFPYKNRGKECVVQYGGWIGVPDLDAPTQILHPRNESWFSKGVVPIPKSVAVTTCAMNFAFRTKYTPMFFQFPLFEGRYNRFGDIWSGLVQKKVLDHLDKVMVVNGDASVRHERASDPFENLKKEAPGLPLNEDLFDSISVLRDSTVVSSYRSAMDSVIAYFKKIDPEYTKHLEKCVWEWLKFF